MGKFRRILGYTSYLCITLVKMRNAALQKKESLTSKYSKIPNVI
jgi:hypothetical protein